MGAKDLCQKQCLSDAGRYADLINGIFFDGEQVVLDTDLREKDTQSVWNRGMYRKKGKVKKQLYRDMIQKVAFGVNFAVIGVENQEEVHYLMPLRAMIYDASEYERQATGIGKKIRKIKNLTPAEFMSKFRKTDRLLPCVTVVLYYGDHWDGSKDLHGLIDFTDIPLQIKKYVNNYTIHVVEIMNMKNTEVFHSDLRQIFDYIRYSKDKNKLREIVQKDEAFQELDEEAYDMLMEYSHDENLINAKKYQRKDGKINMCIAIKEMLADEKAAGLREGKEKGKEIGKEMGLSVLVSIMKKKNTTVDEIYDEITQYEGYQAVTKSQIEKYYKAC